MKPNIIAAIRKDKKDNEGNAPLYIFIYRGRKLFTKISLGRKIHPDLWDIETRRVSKKHPNATLLNSLINKKISDLETKVIEETITRGVVDIAQMINRETIKDLDFYTFAEKQIKEKKYADETKRAYQIVLDKMKVFRPNIKISQIDYQFLQGYESYLRDTLGNEQNTVWGNFKVINTFANDAIKSKYLTVNPFEVYNRPKYKQTERSFLNTSELNKVEKFAADTLDNGYKAVCNYFLFMAYTGLRFSDAIRFKAADHVKDSERIVIETQKTKQITNLYINEKIRPLIEYMTANPLLITQTHFNRCLKAIADHLGIAKKISSHVARHSFGASLVSLGVPERVAQSLLAHGSAASTKIYYHLQAPSLDDAMKKFNA